MITCWGVRLQYCPFWTCKVVHFCFATFSKRGLQKTLYGDDMAEVDIRTGEIIEGDLPPKALMMVREWIELNKIDLLNIWETQEFKKLAPLE